MLNFTIGGVPVLFFAVPILILAYCFRPPPPKPSIVGIDLGTTFSSIAAFEPHTGHITVFDVDVDGEKAIPSVVAFIDGKETTETGGKGPKVLVGRPAVRQAVLNSKRTLFDAKRLVGKSFSPESPEDVAALQKMSSLYPFDILLDAEGRPNFLVPPDGYHVPHTLAQMHETHTEVHTVENTKIPPGFQLVSPEQVSNLILQHLLRKAREQLGNRPIKDVVISIPADFSEAQRNGTQKAAELAGLNLLRFINEPTAAALAYGLHEKSGSSLVVVVDFGGGTLDVSLLQKDGGMFFTVAMAGNSRLGGQDFTENLVRFTIREAERQCRSREKEESELDENSLADVLDSEDVQNVRQSMEDLKLRLTEEEMGRVNLTFWSFVNKTWDATEVREENGDMGVGQDRGCEYSRLFTRDLFEEINADLFRKMLIPIETVLHMAELKPEDVDDVVLVGGTTRIPKVQAEVLRFFGREGVEGGSSSSSSTFGLHSSIDPDLAVVMGVAVQAGISSNSWPITVSAMEVDNSNLTRVEVN
uniref:Uncharacterized protein n=1 Tax=Chromera velia CCMP2878 TaxID=1169474 RepID=A0A0G4HC81_9ALVE|mmetsp:Transcript_43183/g.85146  ORF Transcript_43183/g.85146 Transcript_43183/m.85146 type:complete len:530 (+) Transcript_43183:177-1766(+)|eukprot:Cvel_6294.t1-p1 / transcript=Cvel_6294.t1 / gene=Cvel_6294 / organism=Chromera_velia_CCMP2878 / gene_product=Heat shock 70 kDa protein 13, putative / transcript_product=Heat shock 70 kDa protein 13, putative / location=Cvel_scaffold305:62588-64174(-) / protein_length=529 / sequence_SO=supercontig / SO=protein_coding / is_pseudo=false